MTNLEKLFVQCSERQKSILEQVKQRTELYSQHLASKLLIAGFAPPSWLPDPNASSDCKELNKEDLISKLLRPYPQPSASCSVAHYPGYSNLVNTGDNKEFSDGYFEENPAFGKDLDRKNDPTAPGFSSLEHGESALNSVPELDASVASPEDQSDERILNLYTAPDQSLAGIQRSKSRQKAFELRSSAKAHAKSNLRHQSISDVVPSQIRFSLSITNQPGQNDELSQLAEPPAIGSQSCENRNVVEAHCFSRETGEDTFSERYARSPSYAEIPISVKCSSPLGYSSEISKVNASSQVIRTRITEAMPIPGSEHADNQVNKSPKSAEPSAVYCESFRDRRADDADLVCKDLETNAYTSETTRSEIYSKEQSCGRDSAKADSPSDGYQGIDIARMDSGDEPSQLADPPVIGSQSCENRNVVEAHCLSKETGVDTSSERYARSRNNAEIPLSVKGSFPLGCSSEISKENASSQVNRTRRTEAMPISGSEHAHNHVTKSPKSAGPSAVYCESVRDKRAEDADFVCKDLETNAYTSEITRSEIYSKEQSCGRDSAKADSPSDDYQGIDIARMDSGDEPSQLAEPPVIGSQSCENRNVVEAHCLSRETGVDTSSERYARSQNNAEIPISVKGSFQLGCPSEISKENTSSQVTRTRRTEAMPIPGSEHADNHVNKSPKSAGPSAVYCESFRDRRVEDADFLCKDEETNVYTSEITRSEIYSKEQSCGCDSTKADSPSDGYQGIDIARMASGDDPPHEFVDGSLLKVNLSSISNEGCDAQESGLKDFRRHKEGDTFPSSSSTQRNAFIDESFYPEVPSASAKIHGYSLAPLSAGSARQVQDKADILPSKMADITDIQNHPVKLHAKYGLESSPVHCMDQGDFSDEGRDEGQLVSSVSDKKKSRLSYDHSSVDDAVAKSYDCMIEKADTNPIAIYETNQYPALQSQVLSWPEGEVCNKHGDSSLEKNHSERPSTVRLHGKTLPLESRFIYARYESWPQVKRRKVEHEQAHFTTSQSFGVTKAHTFIRDPDNTYPKTMEIDADTGLIDHVNKTMGDGICSVNTNQKEGIPSSILSQHGEVGPCYMEKDEDKTTPPIINNKQLGATTSSSAMKEFRNPQGSFIEGTRTPPSSCDYLDAGKSGDKQCSQDLCNIENTTDNINSETLNHSSTTHKETQQSSNWEDSLHIPHSVLSSSNEDLQLTDVDQSMPEFEKFVLNAQTNTVELDFSADGFDFGDLELPRTTLERASFLAEICRSASLDRPSSHFSSAFKFETRSICKSVPDENHLKLTDFGNIYPINPDAGIHFQSHSSSSVDYKDSLGGMPYSVSLAYSGERYGWNSRNQPSSPVGKLWDQLSSHSGSSGKGLSSNPELTVFRIEEDPSSSDDNKTMEENAGDTLDETGSSLANHCDKRQPLKDLSNMVKNSPMSVSAEEETLRADSVDYLSSKFSATRKQDEALFGPKPSVGSKHQPSSVGPNVIKRPKMSVKNSTSKSMVNSVSKPVVSNKTSLKGQDPKLSLKESRRNNIVSNVSSFIPLIQQKQAATTCTGKRDVKVKALEAAEAAKRLEEKKENERKMRKEAMKQERAKVEEKNLRHVELEKKKKEEERKKKDADIIAKKRLREEEERKEKDKKRMRLESRLQQREREQEEKKRAENQRTKDDLMNSKKEVHNETKRQQKRQTTKGEGMALQKTKINSTPNEVVKNNEECDTSGLHCEAGEALHVVDKSPRKEDILAQNSEGKSYEISPYQCSDDEDEEDDELPTKKSIPSWASKSSVAMYLPLQQEWDPDVIFPSDSFCCIDKVLVPRKLQQKQGAA